MTLNDRVLQFIKTRQLARPGDQILVAVSGGADSIALLHLLHELRPRLGLRLTVAHINHQLRPGANKDEQFVSKTSQALGLACITRRIRVREQNEVGSLEDLARNKRYQALFQIARRKKISIIALAHHQDDLAETVLMRLVRGTGLLGLQGILPKRQQENCTLIRPLLEISRNDIRKFLRERKLLFREDPTNRQYRFLRNKIRGHLLPLLKKEYNPNLTETLAGLANITSHDYVYLLEESQRLFKRAARQKGKKITLPLAALKRWPPSLQRLVLRLGFQKLKGNLNQLSLSHLQETEAMIQHRPSGSMVHWPSRITVSKAPQQLILQKKRLIK